WVAVRLPGEPGPDRGLCRLPYRALWAAPPKLDRWARAPVPQVPQELWLRPARRAAPGDHPDSWPPGAAPTLPNRPPRAHGLEPAEERCAPHRFPGEACGSAAPAPLW